MIDHESVRAQQRTDFTQSMEARRGAIERAKQAREGQIAALQASGQSDAAPGARERVQRLLEEHGYETPQ